MATKKGYITPLTGIRFVAVTLVFIHHNSIPLSYKLNPIQVLSGHEGYIGVILFFVLSGFLITSRYRDTSSPSLSWYKNYLRNRFARIYPLYFIFCTIALLASKQSYSFTELFLNYSLLKGFFNEIKFSGLAQGWTLTSEEVFYIFAPLLFFARSIKTVGIILLAVPLIGVALVLQPYKPYGFMHNFSFMMTYSFFGAFLPFLFGSLSAVFYLKLKKKKYTTASPFLTYIGFLLIILCIMGLGCLKPDEKISSEVLLGGTNSAWFSFHGIIINSLFLPISLAVFYLGLSLEESWVKNILSLPLVEALGRYSFAFYLIHHGPVHDFISQNISDNWGVRYCLLWVISFALYSKIEVPLKNILKSKQI